MTADWTLPAWLVLAALAVVLLLVVAAVASVVRLRTRIDGDIQDVLVELGVMRDQLAEAAEAQAGPAPLVREDGEFVITSLATSDPTEGDPEGAHPTVEARLFGDIVLREAVVQAAALAHGVRRALSPESRNRIRFEMKREVKRSRRQRRADLREARREWQARQRADVRLDGEDADGNQDTQRPSEDSAA